MSMIANVGRKSLKNRILISIIYKYPPDSDKNGLVDNYEYNIKEV